MIGFGIDAETVQQDMRELRAALSPQRTLLTLTEAARRVGRSRYAVKNRIERGTLPIADRVPSRTGGTGETVVLIDEADLLAQDWPEPKPRVVKPKPAPVRVPLVPRDAARRVLAPPPLVGACRDSDPEIFFAEDAVNIAAAKAVCAGCDVLDRCRAWFLSREEFTTGGGMSAGERARWRRENGGRLVSSVTVR